jgi:molecular chaperone GrpE
MAVKREAQDDDLVDGNADDALDAAMAEVEGFDEGGADLPTELAAEKDRSLRLQAEMENLRTRTSREISESARYAALPLMRDLLPVVDNIERAIEAAGKQGDADPLLEGFKLVHQQLLNVLAQHNCVKIEAQGEPFDPQFHAAILQQPSEEVPASHILLVAQAGYKLHDRVVRPAQVIISTGPAGS